MKQIKISQVDALFTNGSYAIEFLFFYRDGLSTKKLRSALEKLSSSFWPAFGEYKEGMIFFDQYREDDHYAEEYKDHELDIEELNEMDSEVILHYALGEVKSLFFLKVIHYKNGTILIPWIDHLAGDGYSYFYLLSVLAALAQPSWLPLRSMVVASKVKPNHHRNARKVRDDARRNADHWRVSEENLR